MSTKKRKKSAKKQDRLQKKPLDTILLEIASYCDPQLIKTVKSARLQADHPERIHFAICHQDDSWKDYFDLKNIPNCKIKHLSTDESKGSCYARYLCQQMLEDETFVMHTDSHMRFVKHWDTLIIKQWKSFKDPMAIISVYPPDCNKNEMMNYPLDHEAFNNPCDGAVMYACNFRSANTRDIKFCSRHINKNANMEFAYKRSPFMAAGYFFAPAQADRDVLIDPNMYFYGDEMGVSVRLFTHGYNFITPPECYAYHEYIRKNRKFPSNKRTSASNISESKRLLALYNCLPENETIDLGEFCLGTKRTLAEYEAFSEIDFKNRIIHTSAEKSVFDDPESKTAVSNAQKWILNRMHYAKHKEITIIAVHEAGYVCDVRSFIKEAVKQASNKNLHFVIAVKDRNIYSHLTASHFDEDVDFVFTTGERFGELAKTAVNKTAKLRKSDYVLFTTTFTRFAENWDTIILDQFYLIGENNAITTWCYKLKPEDKTKVYKNKIYTPESMNYPYPSCINVNVKSEDMPERAYMLSEENLIFCKLDTLANTHIDLRWGRRAFNFVYSMMLWTNGHDIYYPPNSCFTTKSKLPFNDANIEEQSVIRYLMHIPDDKTRFMINGYESGTARSVELWLHEAGISYK